jgi:hypothetical protein
MSIEERDPLLESSDPVALAQPDRLFFEQGILLDAEDFAAEQTYHRSRLATVLAHLHETGTVAGLDVLLDPELAPGDEARFPDGRPERLRVQPGIAIDRAGRIIEVAEDYCLAIERWYAAQPADRLAASLATGEPNHVTADVFIRFAACERGKTPAFATANAQNLNAVVPSRVRDASLLELVLRDAPVPTPAAPWPEIDLDAPIAERRQRMRDAILRRTPRIAPSEYGAGQDRTSVFLCRVQMPANAPAAAGEPPERRTEPIRLQDEDRLLVVNAAALRTWAGI